MSEKPKNYTMSKYQDDESLGTEAALVLGTKEVVVEQPSIKPYNSVVKLQSLLDAHIYYTGLVTGEQYEWAKAGSIQAVDALDAPALLEKRIKTQSCCRENDTAVFQKVD
jgi:hypothetical protein